MCSNNNEHHLKLEMINRLTNIHESKKQSFHYVIAKTNAIFSSWIEYKSICKYFVAVTQIVMRFYYLTFPYW